MTMLHGPGFPRWYRAARSLLILAWLAAVCLEASQCHAFDTLDSAAVAALQASTELSQTQEYAGVIYKLNGEYWYTAPQPGDETSFKLHVRFPVAAQLVALYHTHPGTDTHLANEFSPQDTQTAKALNLPSYMRVISNYEVLRLSPEGYVRAISAHALCHHMECKDYYARKSHLELVAIGMAR